MSEVIIDAIRTPEPGQFTVIGSGVIGLLVASELATAGHDVTVVSHEGKPDPEAVHSSSQVAIGQFLPWLPEGHAGGVMGDLDLEEIVGTSRAYYEQLAERPHETGVMKVQNVELLNSGTPWPMGLPEAMHATSEELAEPVIFSDPDGSEVLMDTVYTFDTFSINARKTIGYLADKAERLGVKFHRASLTSEDLRQLDGIIVNAAGTGAKDFDSTQTVKNFKGHTFVLKPEQMPRQALSVEDLILMPREDGTVVCGALYIPDPERPVPEKEEAEALKVRLSGLIRNAASLVEGLDPELLDHSEILLHAAGYRVESSAGGIRIAPDESNDRLLHAYGFAGIGWSVGPHFAAKIATQAQAMHEQASPRPSTNS